MPRVSEINISEYNFGYSDPNQVPFSGDVKPSNIFIAGSVIQISFIPTLLSPGKSNYVVLVAVPYYADILKPVTVANGGLTSQKDMPVPGAVIVPVPGAMALAAMGIGAIFFGKLKRRFLPYDYL
jgi:hypothetical protein